MAKRELLMLAHVFEGSKHSVAGWFMSEKLDGQRCLWDGGVSRGELARDVPWANTEKDGRYINQPRATGLWTRYGNVIHAPEWFLNKLPEGICLDGELYLGRGQFQTLRTIVSTLEPGVGWESVQYKVFDAPHPCTVFNDGEIKITNFKKILKNGFEYWFTRSPRQPASKQNFEQTYARLPQEFRHDQSRLPYSTAAAKTTLLDKLEEITALGGEGIMLRKPESFWQPCRSHDLLKVKKMLDAEGTVLGYQWGERTALGSKLLGLMGALVLDFNGRVFSLSGFTDAERQLILMGPGSLKEGHIHPGCRATKAWTNLQFPIGSRVSFHYRELTDDLIPKEARFWRKA